MGVSRRTRQRELKKNMTAVTIVLIFAFIVFSINSVGKFIAEKVIAPIARFTGATEAAFTDTLTTKKLTLFLVSTGAFTRKADTEKIKTATVERGGGGYLFENEGVYSVIYGVYSKIEQAQAQAEALSDSFTPSVITVSLEGISVKITGQKAQLEAVHGALDLINEIAFTLEGASNLQDITAIEEALTTLYKDISLHKTALKGLNSTNESLIAAEEMLSLGEALLNELPKSDQSTYFTALKHAASRYLCEYYAFYNALE